MNKEKIIERKQELETKLQGLVNTQDQLREAMAQNVNHVQAVHGALQDCDWWLNKLEEGKNNKKEPEATKLAKTG